MHLPIKASLGMEAPFQCPSPYEKFPCMMTKVSQHKPRLGPALRTARVASGQTQAELAAKAGLTRDAIARLEAGGGRMASLDAAMEAMGNLGIGGRNMPPGDHLGTRLAALRKTRGLSRREAAARAGISLPTATMIEIGAPTHVDPVERLAAVLGAALDIVPTGITPPWWKSAQSDSWTTPVDLADAMAQAVGGMFDLDVASPGPHASPIRARRHLTMAEDGLSVPWSGTCWANPPYGGALAHWVPKMHREVDEGRAHMVMALLPAYTGRSWWKHHVEKADLRWFVEGRLRFGGAVNSATFDSVIVAWGGSVNDRRRIENALIQWDSQRPGRRKRMSS